MKLELKHVAAYLPYKVRYKSARWSLPLVLDADSVNEVVNRQYKMHLRPLSDLTKEIEHNGERFVPVDRLKMPDIRYHLALQNLTIDPSNAENLPYWLARFLLEWHFDLYSLIENGLAIDINTLELTPSRV